MPAIGIRSAGVRQRIGNRKQDAEQLQLHCVDQKGYRIAKGKLFQFRIKLRTLRTSPSDSLLESSTWFDKAHPMAFMAFLGRLLGTSLIVVGVGPLGNAVAQPNLLLATPSTWSDSIAISTVSSATSDGAVSALDSALVRFAIVNVGTVTTGSKVAADIFLDETLKARWQSEGPLSAGFYFAGELVLDPLPPGTHSVRVVIDPDNSISESNEADNTRSKQFVVQDDDPNDQIGQAVVLGTITRSRIFDDAAIDSPLDVDLYSFTVTAGQRLSFDIDFIATPFDSYLRIFDSQGVELATNDNGAGPGEESTPNSYLEHTFNAPGTFYLGVSSSGNSSYSASTGQGDISAKVGAYRLVVSPGIAGHITRGGIQYPVDLLNAEPGAPGIDPTRPTWIVIHGWRSSRNNENIAGLTTSVLLARPLDQVLTLDWSRAADTLLIEPWPAEDSIPLVASWAGSVLRAYGFSGSKLALIGHSFGSYVANELSERVPGGVRSIVALDPAENIPDILTVGFNPNTSVDFSLNSEFSWAFYSSSLILGANEGNEETPTTADEAFVVANTDHADIVFLFAWIWGNPASVWFQFFSPLTLLAGVPHSIVPDLFNFSGGLGGAYEGVIQASPDGRSPVSIDFEPLPMLQIGRASDHLRLSWRPGRVAFQLQRATDLSAWSDLGLQPVQMDGSNVLEVSPSTQVEFFRLRR